MKRLIELRGDLLMGLAIGMGRVSEMFDRISSALHAQAMSDLAQAYDISDPERDR
jgi:hypothetical protein